MSGYFPLEPRKVQTCKGCGCTNNDCRVCFHRSGRACHWVKEDWCSCCETLGPPSNPKAEREKVARILHARVKPGPRPTSLPPERRPRKKPLTTTQKAILDRLVKGDDDLHQIAKDFKVCGAYVEKVYYTLFLVPNLRLRIMELERALSQIADQSRKVS